jgi:hypothetical protein
VLRERTVEGCWGQKKRQSLRSFLSGEYPSRTEAWPGRHSALCSKAAARREVQEKRQLVRRTGTSVPGNASPSATAFESDEVTPLVRQLQFRRM